VAEHRIGVRALQVVWLRRAELGRRQNNGWHRRRESVGLQKTVERARMLPVRARHPVALPEHVARNAQLLEERLDVAALTRLVVLIDRAVALELLIAIEVVVARQ